MLENMSSGESQEREKVDMAAIHLMYNLPTFHCVSSESGSGYNFEVDHVFFQGPYFESRYERKEISSSVVMLLGMLM